MSGLDSVSAKLARAEEHLSVYCEDMIAYLKSSKHDVRFGVDPKLAKARFVYRVEPEPPLRLSILIGDCVHNARSCLDNLVCALVRLKMPGAKCAGTAFPMFTSSTDYAARRDHLLNGVPAAAKAVIDELQPHTWPENARSHPLAVLNRLSNSDKHRAPALTTAYSYNTRVWIKNDVTEVVHELTFPQRLRSGGEIVLSGVPASISEGMAVHVRGSSTVTFRDLANLQIEPVEDIVGESLKFIRSSVVPRLEVFFT